jgi:MFS family permease
MVDRQSACGGHGLNDRSLRDCTTQRSAGRPVPAAAPVHRGRHAALAWRFEFAGGFMQRRLSLTTVLICGGALLTLSMGIRHGFGLFQLPMISAHAGQGWTRETFAIALGLQNLLWGVTGPIAGAWADRFGAVKVLIIATLMYSAGLVIMALATHGLMFSLGAGVLIGCALSGTTYSLIYGVIGRTAAPEKRSQALGIAAAAGSFGQFLMVPVEQSLISWFGWQHALLILAAMALLMAPLAAGLREPETPAAAGGQSIREAIREAFGNRSFQWLTAGYFVCGFQVVFIGVHLPAYLKDHNMEPGVAVAALALVGLFNVFGTYTAGQLGARMPKRYILSFIYFARAVVIVAFLWVPLTPWSVYLFAAAMGLLWLSTVPVTNGIVAGIFGVRYLGMLGGFVFFSHQVGSFMGVWLGGFLYDKTGSYDWVWGITIALGIFAGLANLPVKEAPIERLPELARA